MYCITRLLVLGVLKHSILC